METLLRILAHISNFNIKFRKEKPLHIAKAKISPKFNRQGRPDSRLLQEQKETRTQFELQVT